MLNKTLNTIALIFLNSFLAFAQNDTYNLDFERNDTTNKLYAKTNDSTLQPYYADTNLVPANWGSWKAQNYSYGYLDSTVKEHGKYSFLMNCSNKSWCEFKNAIPVPDSFSFKKITLTFYIKTENADGNTDVMLKYNNALSVLYDTGIKGVFSRYPTSSVSIDGMRIHEEHFYDNDVRISGTTDWTEYSITLDSTQSGNLADSPIWIYISFHGTGKVWFDNFQIFLDDKDYGTASNNSKAIKPIIPDDARGWDVWEHIPQGVYKGMYKSKYANPYNPHYY